MNLALCILLLSPPFHADGAATGIDVSRHSGAVEWATVAAAGHGFAYVKATEGVDYEDSAFREHWAGAGKAGLRRGAYHFFVTEDDPEEQARFFLAVLGDDRGELRPVVDVELIGHHTRSDWVDSLGRFLELLHAELGVRPVLYTSPKFWDREVVPKASAELATLFAEHPLWLAEYGVDEPTRPEGWDCWQLWQYAGDAQVPGVEKSADLSRIHPDAGWAPVELPPSSASAAP